MSDLPRILMCTFDVVPGPTGASRRLTEYLKGLCERFQVVVLTTKTPDHSHIQRYEGARLLRVPVGSGDLSARWMAFDRAVRRQLESEEYLLAHFTDPFGGYAVCERKGDYGFRIIYEAHQFPSQELRFTHPQTEGDRRFLAKVRRQELYCLMNADVVVTGSEVTRQFIQQLGVPEPSLRVLRAPVDLSMYSPEALGKPDGTPMRIIYLGSQVGYQGLPTLLRAMHHASKQVELRLAVIGPKHLEWQAHLEDLVGDLKLTGKVDFQAPVSHDDLFKVLASGDVGVVPLDDLERNRVQGGALAKISEYLAAGRPVIAADLPVTRELLPPGAALFYPPGDFNALGEKLIELSKDPERRVKMGREGRSQAERLLDASSIRGRVVGLYDQLLELPSPSPKREAADPITGVTPTNRMPKTDPAIPAPAEVASAEPAEPTALVALSGLGPPSDEPAPASPASSTEPGGRPPDGPPVVMGVPVSTPGGEPWRVRAPAEGQASGVSGSPRNEPAPGGTGEVAAPESAWFSGPLSAVAPAVPTVTAAPAEPMPDWRTGPATPIELVTSAEPAETLDPEVQATAAKVAAASTSPSAVAVAQEPTAPAGMTSRAAAVSATPDAAADAQAPSGSDIATTDFAAGSGSAVAASAPAAPALAAVATSAPAVPSATAVAASAPTAPAPAAVATPAPAVSSATAVAASAPAVSSATAVAASAPAAPSALAIAAAAPVAPSARAEAAPVAQVPPATASAPVAAAASATALAISTPAAPAETAAVAQAPSATAIATPAPAAPSATAAASAIPAPSPLPAALAGKLEAPPLPALPGAPAALVPPSKLAAPAVAADSSDEPEEISSDEILEADDAVLLEESSPAPAVDPWLAQLTHGYCPPDGGQFARHTPPTNFPGRDQDPPAPPVKS